MRKQVILWEDGWKSMENGIAKLKKIVDQEDAEPFTPDEYMSLYTTIYNMCIQKPPHNYCQNLYDGYRSVIEGYLTSTVLPSLKEKHQEFLLRAFLQRWVTHKLMIRWLSRFFHYLDRYYVDQRMLPTLNQAGVYCFRDLVYQEMFDKVRDAVLAFVHLEREGGVIDRVLLRNVLCVFMEIDPVEGDESFYDKDFEGAMLEDTSAYYAGKASVWIVKDSCPEYMIKAEECLLIEKERASRYLQSSSEPKLLETAEKELLSVFSKELIENPESGCLSLLQGGKVDDLSRMYRLFSRIAGGLEPVSEIFQSYITARGMALVTQVQEAAAAARNRKSERKEAASHEHDFVRNVLKLHDDYLRYVEDCFQSHTLFHKALKDAFDVFCNKDIPGSTSPEVLANFCDYVLKKGGDESDEAVEGTLEKVVKLLNYVNDKDVFGEFCRKRLARRLLFDKCTNDDTERSFLSMLKQQCGGPFTSKMEGMTNDIRHGREMQSDFAEYLETNQKSKEEMIDLSVTVLTTGFWPSYKSHDLNLPSEMRNSIEQFKEFYKTKTKHRRITWIYSMGSCNVYAKYGQKTTELILTPYQACVLLLFNTSDQLTLSEITSQLNLEEDDVTRLLYSLSCGKYKILNKEPNSKTMSATDNYVYNPKFTSSSRKIRIPLPPVEEKKKVTEEEVGKDRRHAIEASLVRVMKSRKVLNHQNLISECVEQLAKMFNPDIKVIKQKIEDLIVREYLERDAENPNVYKYLA